MKKLILTFPVILILTISVLSQTQLTANTLKLEDGKTGEKATIQDMRRLSGTWRGEGLGGTVEEIYSEAQDGIIMGSFRFLDKGKTVFYELILVQEENETLAVRLKHFGADFTGWEEKDKNVLFRFVKKDGNRMYFEGQTFEFIGKKDLNIYVAVKQKDGSLKEEIFRYRRK
jgi:hypothetical protein